jgi:uncharacterized protein
MEISGKRVIVTGAASGIGRALVARLAAYPCQIIAADIDAARLAEAVSSLPSPRAVVYPFVCDLGGQAGVDALFVHALATLGGVDIFVANAGFAYYERFGAGDWAHIETITRVNVLSPLYALARMRALNGEREHLTVMTASAMGLVALPGYALYGATKAALHHFTEAYRYEQPPNARLMVVYPIATRTDFFRTGAPIPFPSQTADSVARQIVRGIERDQRSVHTSMLFRVGYAVGRVFPLVYRIYQAVEARRFRRWLARR